MTNIAILGFGVVGGGVADLITKNAVEVKKLGGDDIHIKYILDLYDFPESPFADRVVHDYSVIVNDPDVSVVIEAMGGSHPAYEYTTAALKAGKSVITSNKEVVARFGDEFLSLAKEMGVVYRFEASVGGGIPVLSPLISCVKQNRIHEVRGILNGTTNYILTQMFTYGDSFEHALADAQAKGYAERIPDADILGTDACRKITILAALVGGKLYDTEDVSTEGITKIRAIDVRRLDQLGCTVKLVGRAIFEDAGTRILVSPFVVSEDSALFGVKGVYNAVEVIGEPIGNVLFFGRGAGAGPTASAMVGDLMLTMREGVSYASPVFEKGDAKALLSRESFTARWYVAFQGECDSLAKALFGEITLLSSEGECAFLTGELSEDALAEKIAAIESEGYALTASIPFLS